MTPGDVVERLWAKVQKAEGDGCWTWPTKAKNKYGLFSFRGQKRGVHRVAWEFTHGPIPPGMVVCHRCDNPPCVRPEHLFLGTQSQNLADMRSKGRYGFGVLHPHSKLTPDSVRESRRQYASGDPLAQIARRLGVDPTTLKAAVIGETWGHVREAES